MADKNVKKEEKPKMVGREEQKVKLLKAKKASKAASKGIHITRQAHYQEVQGPQRCHVQKAKNPRRNYEESSG